ncbi:hypothetical protein [uncultured Exiguobacterium sp.]|uniref:hypothetical protein n=1 Tax=uncultured Exiguobacterium sp. TaxID=202669 RepID=UPI0025F0B03C|nr:hypothetical protein [uncultured Exiguobacterium sp.]
MKRWLLLTNEELKRSTKLLVLLISGLIVAEIASLLYQIYDYQHSVEATMRIEQISELDAIEQGGGALTFAQATNFYDSIIVLAMGMIVLFAFWIWYRDWMGETKYIYRLLLLPGSRRAIFASKMATLLLVVASLIGIQWVFLLLSRTLYLWLLPDAQQVTASINEYSFYMKLFYTMYPSDILFILLMTFIVISFVFMTVLLERSFRKSKAFLLVGLTGIALIAGWIVIGVTLSAISNDLSQLHMQFYLGYVVLLTLYVSYKNLRLVQTRLSV